MTEVWKPLIGFEGRYKISSMGQIQSLKTGKILSSRLLKGYPGVGLYPPGINHALGKVTVTVHSVVALTFLGPRPFGHQVNHKDGDKLNPNVENLEYVTCTENIRHSWEILGNQRYGICNPAAKITSKIVQSNRQEYRPGKSGHKEEGTGANYLARKYGVTKRLILDIIHRKIWKVA